MQWLEKIKQQKFAAHGWKSKPKQQNRVITGWSKQTRLRSHLW
ncbi:hypothetical protein [Calothrix sp. NIES-2100]